MYAPILILRIFLQHALCAGTFVGIFEELVDRIGGGSVLLIHSMLHAFNDNPLSLCADLLCALEGDQ